MKFADRPVPKTFEIFNCWSTRKGVWVSMSVFKISMLTPSDELVVFIAETSAKEIFWMRIERYLKRRKPIQ